MTPTAHGDGIEAPVERQPCEERLGDVDTDELAGRAAGLTIGGSTHWYSGLPENARGLSGAGNFSNEHHLVPRGSVGRNPADFEADVHVGYPIRVGSTTRLELLADMFNVFNRQSVIRYDDRYNLIRDGLCSGVPATLCTDDGGLRTRPGTLEPVASLTDPRRTATNPDYLRRGVVFTSPRSLRVGVRLTF